MLHFPSKGFNEEKLLSAIKSVDINNPADIYQWGINTRIICKDNLSEVELILDNESTVIDYNIFWEGYWYGIEPVINQCSLQKGKTNV